MEKTVALTDVALPSVDAMLRAMAPFDIKLRPPDLRDRTIVRAVLDHDAIASHDIVIVTAGAGYGKTTLLAQAIRSDLPWAWLTLHTEDNDPATLVAYLLRSLQTAWALPEAAVGHFSDPGGSEASILLPRLSELVESIAGEGMLVLDDIDAIDDHRCLRIIEAVLEGAPSGLHILIGGRSLPPLQLERLRTRRRILELHEDALALSYTESSALIDAAHLSLDPIRVRQIFELAEGWAAGVYLLALAADESGLPELSPASVAGYVHEQILAGIDPSTADFLMRTSVLEVVDSSSCDALLGRDDSAAVLEHLARSHLFVAPVAGSAHTYRYHGVLADTLRTELEARLPEEGPRLHARASEHFAARNEREAAVRHAVAAGRVDRVASLVWGHFPLMLGLGQGDTLISWFRALTNEQRSSTPVFAVTEAITACLSGDGRQARLRLTLARNHSPTVTLPDGLPLTYFLNLIEALICPGGVTEMVLACDRALASTQSTSPLHNLPIHLKGCGLALLGDLAGAHDALDEGIEIGRNHPAAVLSGLSQKAILATEEDDWDTARWLVQQGQDLYEHFRLENIPSQARFNGVAATVAIHDGRRDAAEVYVLHGRVLVSRMNDIAPWLTAGARIMLGHAELRLGRPAIAAQLATEAQTDVARVPDAKSLNRSLRALEDTIGTIDTRSVALTTAEIRVLSFLPTHLTLSQIAEELSVSVNTVKSHVSAIYRKLGALSRGDAVDRARAFGLLSA